MLLLLCLRKMMHPRKAMFIQFNTNIDIVIMDFLD